MLHVHVLTLLSPSPPANPRNYIVLAISESIREIIRVLQLTSPTEEQGAFAAEQGVDQAGLPGGLLPGSLAARIYQAKELISQTGTNVGAYFTLCVLVLCYVTVASRVSVVHTCM